MAVYNVDYPIAFHTVDVAIMRTNIDGRTQVLLVMKKKEIENNEIKWRFPGGFVDPTDDSAETAALREMSEETHLTVKESTLKYIGSARIDDPRYRDTPHKIITSFFSVEWKDGETGPGNYDDVAVTRWFNIDELDERIVNPVHHVLMNIFLDAHVVRLRATQAISEVEQISEIIDDFVDGAAESVVKLEEALNKAYEKFCKDAENLPSYKDLSKRIESKIKNVLDKVKSKINNI